MPVLQQLLRSCRGCQVLSHMQLHPSSGMSLLSHNRPGPLAALATAPPVKLQQLHVCQACSRPLSLHADNGSIISCSNRNRTHSWSSGVSSSSSGSSSRPGLYKPHQQVCSASTQPSGSSSEPPSTVLTLPTILTLGRVAAIPALIAAWFWQDPSASAAVTGLFIVASVTDWLDGYLARKMNASTPFGAFLDPVADKLMVAAVLVLLCTQPLAAGPLAGNTWLVPVATLVIIGREITMSALREWAATLGPAASAAVAVNAWGKWKTATQMVSLTCLLLTKDGAHGTLGLVAAAAGPPLLVVAAYLTAHSLALYITGLWKFLK